ncbi:pentatricopeptide repeat domain-containing protein 3, mitochondrial [Synchiropus splendidus]|uniref:pentatricopeptide repeat domain-containing protein 3, mitochondrial n=1 Tax=Synchiropus splendidus TaxID=270530 RepID=UPI00237E58F9|nr:pentatricopeptide repeat domain-containing protein 3, mitochondrial [Synchiropus splendidus]
MAAASRNVGFYINKNCRFLFSSIEQLKGRSFCWAPVLQQQATELQKGLTENISLPRKKEWNKTAVLEALASTVNRDPTAYQYDFQDDPYLTPRTSSEYKMFLLSQESGRSAAKYFVNTNPKFFTKDFAEPHIPCLMPETVTLRLEDVSEEALKERISLRKVTAAVEMYDQLLQAGTVVSMETVYELLDLISFYCDKDPVQEGAQTEDPDEPGEEVKQRSVRGRRGRTSMKPVWKDNNNAERIFNLLPEKDTRCYSALIRGMQKHGNSAKAFSMYTDMLNNRLTADVHIFNALIAAVPDVRDQYNERWDLIVETLNQMNQQKVQPNLLTFNTVLKALRQCGPQARNYSLNTINEMRALGIAPSLATYNHILVVFYKPSFIGKGNPSVLQELLSYLEGQRFTCQDPDDVMFFCTAMKICLAYKDVELAYKVHSLVETSENWRLLGDSHKTSVYYFRFFSLLCMMEHVDTVMRWYRRLVPSKFYPNSQGLMDLLQALDTDGRLDLIPTIWKDIRSLGHDNKLELVEELLTLMARDEHPPEVQESFAVCALEVKDSVGSLRGRPVLEWTNTTLSNVTTLLLRANKTGQAWEMLQVFKEKNRVPSDKLLDDFLSVCKRDSDAQRAVELVQLSSAFCLQATPKLAKRALTEFNLKEEQRSLLSELDTTEQPED